LQKEQGGFRCLHIGREVGFDAGFFFAAEGRVGEDDVDAFAVADFADAPFQSVAVGDLRRFQTMQQQIHLRQHIRQRFGFLAIEAGTLQGATLLGRAYLWRNVVVGFDQKTAGAAGRIKDGFTEARVADLDHEADYRARCIELAGIARRVAHFAQHRFVEVREGVDFFAGAEMDTVNLVNDVAQQVAADHAVLNALEDVGHHLALAAFFAFAGQAAQINEQTLAATAIGTHCLFLTDEGQQFVAGDAILPCGPVAPAVRCFNYGLVRFAVEFGFLFVDSFEVVEKLEEHDPGEQWQAIHVAIQAFVLAQNLVCGADQGGEIVARG
jgi:hypothetical protein